MSKPQVALVTGAGARRVGWHVAQGLAARGYALAIHHPLFRGGWRRDRAHLAATGSDAAGFQADLTQEAAVRSMVDGARSLGGSTSWSIPPQSGSENGWRR